MPWGPVTSALPPHPEVLGGRFKTTPLSCRENSRHLRHAGAWPTGECWEHLELIQDMDKKGRLPSFKAGVGWKKDEAREECGGGPEKKALSGQDCVLGKDSIEPRGLQQTKQSATVMQTNSKESITQSGSGVPVTLQTGLPAKTLAPSDQASTGSGEIQIPIGSAPAEHGSRHASRRSRANISLQAHGHSHRPGRTHSHCTPEGLETQEPDSEATEPSSSISELRHLLQWLHKSFPFIVILCAKLIVQHALGIAVGIGLLTTFLYVNKSIQSQVFLRGCWYMLTEEVSQIYQAVVPVPVWFRYLITYQEQDGYTGLTLGVVLALVYLMLKLLGLYGQWSSIQKALQVFLNKQPSLPHRVSKSELTPVKARREGEILPYFSKLLYRQRGALAKSIVKCNVITAPGTRTPPK
ncbi:RNFT1 ligase, partial [Polypterus senegalus]